MAAATDAQSLSESVTPPRRRGRAVAVVVLLATCVPLLSALCWLLLRDSIDMVKRHELDPAITNPPQKVSMAPMHTDNGLPSLSAVRLPPDIDKGMDGKIAMDDYLKLAAERNISVGELFSVDVGTIAIDPGHGGRDSGASENALEEKALMLGLAHRVKNALLMEHGITAVLTRTEDRAMSIGERLEVAQNANAGIMLSLHLGKQAKEGLGQVRSYYFGMSADPKTIDSAMMVNQNNRMTMSQLRQAMNMFEESLNAQESQHIAKRLQSSVAAAVRSVAGDKVVDGGIAAAPMTMLMSGQLPTVMLELNALEGVDGTSLWSNTDYRESVAQAIANGLVRYIAERAAKNIQTAQR